MGASSDVRRYVVAIGACIVGTIIAGVLSSRSHATSDAALRKRFNEHRAAFDSLATMAVADTDQEVRASARSALGLLLQRTGLPALSRDRDGVAIWFVMVTRDGTRKGYLYSLEPREPVLGSLDDAPQYGYVALAPGWFLFLQPAN